MELREIDLNLLVLFADLLKTARISTTAEKMGLSQPAVSNSIMRLRRLLGDELFVRTAEGMLPTPYARSLAEPVVQALATIHGAINQNSTFDPFTSRRKFTIATTDVGEIHFMPEIMTHLSKLAPGLNISTMRNYAVDLPQAMAAGDVDLAIGHLPQLKAGYYRRRLLNQHYVCLFRRGHSLDKDGLTLEDFIAADHVGIVAAGTGHGIVDEIMTRMNIERQVRLRVPHFVAVGHILSHTEMIATVPEVLAYRISKPFDLVWRQHPVALPEISISLFWHAKMHGDAGNQWVRNLIYDTRPRIASERDATGLDFDESLGN